MSVVVSSSGLKLRLGVILTGLRRVLAVRAARDPVLAAMLLLLWNRLGRALARVSAIADRYHAGTLRAAPKARHPSAVRPSPPPRDVLPRHPAWVLRLAPECAAYAENLRRLLAEPEVLAMAEAAPQLRRLLRPLWRMLQPGLPPPVLQAQTQTPQAAPGRPVHRRRTCGDRASPAPHPAARPTHDTCLPDKRRFRAST